MVFICLRCGKRFPSRPKLLEHLSRKFICEAKVQDITQEEVYEKSQKRWEEDKKAICAYCDREFSEKNNAFRCHQSYCKKKKQEVH